MESTKRRWWQSCHWYAWASNSKISISNYIGTPIFLGYIVEKIDRKAGGDWTPCNTTPVAGTEHTVSGLANGETYEFRIRAVNEAGPGRPSKSTDPVTCKVMTSKLTLTYLESFW